MVVVYDTSGVEIARAEVVTAGAPAEIMLSPDRSKLRPDGADLSFVAVRTVDYEGHIYPWADQLVCFSLNGPGEIIAVDSGDQTTLEPFQAHSRKAFHGMCMVVIRTRNEVGVVRLHASADGPLATSIDIYR